MTDQPSSEKRLREALEAVEKLAYEWDYDAALMICEGRSLLGINKQVTAQLCRDHSHKLKDILERLALTDQPAAPAPPCDNPSGTYCPDCRAVGLSHCSDPEHCEGMKPMQHHEGCSHQPATPTAFIGVDLANGTDRTVKTVVDLSTPTASVGDIA